MKDINNKDVKVGDTVAYCKVGNSRLMIGKIIKLTPKHCTITRSKEPISRASDQISLVENISIVCSYQNVLDCIGIEYDYETNPKTRIGEYTLMFTPHSMVLHILHDVDDDKWSEAFRYDLTSRIDCQNAMNFIKGIENEKLVLDRLKYDNI